MSATLTWFFSGLGTKTGTTAATLFADLKTLIDSKAGDANFKWEVGGSNTGSTPYYLLLRRKDGSAGRILVVHWSSSPAGNNAAILDQTPNTSQVYVAWFPAGNTATASNLTAASGTICGDDSNCVKVAPMGAVGTIYTTSHQAFYVDSAEAVWFGFGNPASSGTYGGGAGDILVDAADTAYGGTFGIGNGSFASWGTTSMIPSWSTGGVSAGASTPTIRSNYLAANTSYCIPMLPSGSWAAQAVGASDVLSDSANSKRWYVPIAVMPNAIKGAGFPLKLRQVGLGSGTTSAFEPVYVTGPTVEARQFNQLTTGGNGYPWFTNVKI